MTRADVGLIGGTGLSDILLSQEDAETVWVDTPFGPPSAPPLVTRWEGMRIAFIARHGVGHKFCPSSVPYRANIWALKSLGVSAVIASGATGSLREDIEPGHLVLCDQVIDRTFRRASTFFNDGIVVHVVLNDPFCSHLRRLLARAGENIDTMVHHAGTYVCMEGPQFSTRAESNMHRHWGGDVIGMTCMPEAKLAREAQLCYALVAMPTDYDCWRPVDPAIPQDDLLTEINRNLRRASSNAVSLIQETLRLMKAEPMPRCPCHEALKQAIWTEERSMDPAVRKRLESLLGPRPADMTDDES